MTVREVAAYLRVAPRTIYCCKKKSSLQHSAWAATGGSIPRRSSAVLRSRSDVAISRESFARVLFGSYLVLGREVSSLVSGLDSALTAATNRAAALQSTPQP